MNATFSSEIMKAAVVAIGVCAVAVHAEPRRGAGRLRNADQATGRTSPNPACNVLTAADVRNLTGFSGYNEGSAGDSPGQGAGGGASCQYSAPRLTVDARGNPVRLKAPLLSIVLIDGKNYTHTMAIGNGCRKEAASGVGDEAFFEVCPNRNASRTAPLYVKAGTKDLIVQMDVDEPDTEASLRPKVIAVAKAAAAKLH